MQSGIDTRWRTGLDPLEFVLRTTLPVYRCSSLKTTFWEIEERERREREKNKRKNKFSETEERMKKKI